MTSLHQFIRLGNIKTIATAPISYMFIFSRRHGIPNIRLLLIGGAVLLTSLFFAIKPRALPVTGKGVGPAEVLEAEKLLQHLGYWTGPIDGDMDEGSRHALIAFEKVERLLRTGELTPATLKLLRKARRPSARFKSGFHIEIDLKRQVLFVVNERAHVELVLPVSTGNGELFTEGGWTRYAKTPRGTFQVYKKIDEWRKSPLGLLFYPSYIIGGVAIHGSNVIPTRAATHGCIAVPMHAAQQLSQMMPIGTNVIVYGSL